MNEIGYDTLEPRILNAADYGVPQRRNRIIFMGYRKGLTPPQYPEPTVKPENRVTLLEAVGDLITDTNKKVKVNPSLLSISWIALTDALLILVENQL